MKVKLIKNVGKLKPGIYDFAEDVVKNLVKLGFAEVVKEPKPKAATPKKKKKIEKVAYENK